MPFLGLDLAESASSAMGSGLVHALPYLVMIAVVALTGWYQQRQMQARSTSAPNPQQQTISRVMLFFLPAISFGLPAGVVLYFIVSNLYRVGQQAYITHTMYKGKDPIPVGVDSDDDAKPTGKGKGGSGAIKEKPSGPPKKPGTGGPGRVTPPKGKPTPSSGNGAARKPSKTFTSDPKRKASSGSTPPASPPRPPRKKRK
jgi:YidC/Oxa1 family membrane protein insertase